MARMAEAVRKTAPPYARHLLCVLVVLLAATRYADALLVSERVPDGGYCGSYSHNLVVGRLNISQASSTVNVSLRGFGMTVTCLNEQYAYNPKDHHAALVNVDDPNDCLGQLLRNASLKADISFNPTADTVIINVGFAHVACHKCA